MPHPIIAVPMVCATCGEFFVTRARGAANAARYCSRACRAAGRKGRPTVPYVERFFRYVGRKTASGCIPWTGACNLLGYGVLNVRKGEGSRNATHIAYELAHGPIPDGLFVLHRCDNPSCVNPTHLFLGTVADNTADMIAKGRQAVGEKMPHARLTEEAVRDIRIRYAAGAASQYQLAAEYKVSQSRISRVVNGKRWKHVT